jgi:hypothetical protein
MSPRSQKGQLMLFELSVSICTLMRLSPSVLHCVHHRASTQLRQYNLYVLGTFLCSANDLDRWIATSRLEFSMTHEHRVAGSACTSQREISQQ